MTDTTPVSWSQLTKSPRKQAFFAEDDLGYDWLIKAWTVLYHNVVYITGIINDVQYITGIVRDVDDITGKIG